jgi:hypothetical protein
MKLWQKNFLFAALLFIIIFYICVFFLASPSVVSLVKNAQDAAVSEEYAISRAMDSTFSNIKTESHKSAAVSFAGYYEKNGIFLEIGSGSDILLSDVPYSSTPQTGTLAWARHGKDSYIQISDQLTTGYYLIYMKSVNDVEYACIKQCLVSVTSATGVILVLCILLYIILKKVNEPLDRLAHELRTPLTVINGYAETLMISKLPEKQRYFATRYILDESKTLYVHYRDNDKLNYFAIKENW